MTVGDGVLREIIITEERREGQVTQIFTDDGSSNWTHVEQRHRFGNRSEDDRR